MTFEELMSTYEDNSDIYKLLKACMKNVVPFIGAGMSVGVGTSTNDFPTWRNLLEGIAKTHGILKKIQRHLDNGNFEEAACDLQEKLGKHDFLQILSQKYDTDKIDKERIVKQPLVLLTRLFDDIVLTTNFDRVLRTLYDIVGNSFVDSLIPFDKRIEKYTKKVLHERKHVLFKLHGDIEYTSDLVLDKKRYDETYGCDQIDMTKPMPRVLQLACERKILLFLGCSMEGDRTLQVIKEVSESEIGHFALVELPKETENMKNPFKPNLWKYKNGPFNNVFETKRKRLSDLCINRIWYPYGQHEAVTVLLSELLNETKKIPDYMEQNEIGTLSIIRTIKETQMVNDQNGEKSSCTTISLQYTGNSSSIADIMEQFGLKTGTSNN